MYIFLIATAAIYLLLFYAFTEPETRARWWARTWPVLLWVLTPLLLMGRLLIAAYTLAYIRLFLDKKIDLKAKCPGCGWRVKHRIEFDELKGCVIHTCVECGARFPEAPVQPAELWSEPMMAPVEIAEEQAWDGGASIQVTPTSFPLAKHRII